MQPSALKGHGVCGESPHSSPLSVVFAAMTGLTDVVVFIIGQLYEKLKEPLPTIVSALVRPRPGSKSLAILIGALLTPPQIAYRFFRKYDLQSPGICAFLLLVVPAMGSLGLIEGPSSNPNLLLRTYAIFYTTLISSVVLYRLSPFHPLAKYPGPTLAKVSNLWFVSIRGSALKCERLISCLPKAYLGWQGRQHVHYMNLHKKYGDVVRVGA